MISIIVAVAENNAIGKNNQLLWHLPADMKIFREKTTGHCVITGRKNYESIPEKFRPLPNRTNIVITRQNNYTALGAIVVSSLHEAIEKAKATGDDEIFIIGGGEIYAQSISIADKIYLTKVHHTFDADTFFPQINMNEWDIISSSEYPADEKNIYAFTFIELKRKNINLYL
ncbi:MAG: dihydrofolate reductase [Bacteroidia bacterium]